MQQLMRYSSMKNIVIIYSIDGAWLQEITTFLYYLFTSCSNVLAQQCLPDYEDDVMWKQFVPVSISRNCHQLEFNFC